jgi:hypothetical protein
MQRPRGRVPIPAASLSFVTPKRKLKSARNEGGYPGTSCYQPLKDTGKGGREQAAKFQSRTHFLQFMDAERISRERADSSGARKIWGERRGLNPRPSVPQTDALPAELRSPQTKYTQFRPHSVFSKVGLASLAKLGQIGVIYTNLLGALTIFAPPVRRSQFILGN